MGVVLHLFRVTRPDPSASDIYYPILGILMWPIGSMFKLVQLAHVHGFESHPRIFFLSWHAIQLLKIKYFKNPLFQPQSDRNPMNGKS